jgi:hypothetical protein
MPHIVENILTGATTLLETSSQSEVCTRNYGLQSRRSPNFKNLGVLRQNDIWVLASWPSTKNTIRGKVMVSPKFKSW